MRRYFFPGRTTMLALLGAGLLAGCQSPPPTSMAGEPDAPAIRNNCYSLLHQLFGDEKDVSILRFIRPEQTQIKDLTKTIAAAAKDGEQELEQFAKADPTIQLNDTLLP